MLLLLLESGCESEGGTSIGMEFLFVMVDATWT